jgi:hypothetical protein
MLNIVVYKQSSKNSFCMYNILIHILLSYIITIDAKIIYNIKGKGQQNESTIYDYIFSTLFSSN